MPDSRFLLIAILLCLIYAKPAPAQEKNDTLDYYSLPAGQQQQWKELMDNWEKTHFDPFLNRQKIRLSCAHCESVRVKVAFEVFEEHAHFRILSAKKCGGKFTTKQLKEIELLLMKLSFPAFFNGKIVLEDFGNALKC